jgi:hypothetical protein
VLRSAAPAVQRLPAIPLARLRRLPAIPLARLQRLPAISLALVHVSRR